MLVIDKDSKGTIASIWAVVALIAVVLIVFVKNPWVLWPILAVLLLFAFFVLWFHRIPNRKPAEGDESLVTSVADGKVVIVDRVYEKEYFKGDCIMISVYMDFFDVHANFWPLTGRVTYYKYHPGKYLLAFLPKSSELNEHASSCLKNPYGEVFFKQIAGTFARRIVCYSELDDLENRGDQCGVIKFGSRIDLFLPLDAEVKVKIGDKVRAVESVIAVLPPR